MSPFRLIIRGLDAIMESLCVAFGLVLGAIIVLICVDIFSRNLSIGSLPWMVEITEYAMYGGTFLAAPWVLRQGSHVRVDLLLISLPKKAAQRLEQTTDVCGFFVSLVMAYYGSVVVLDAYRFKMQQFKSLVVPEWILLLPIVIGCTLLAIEFLLRIFRVEGVVAEKYNPADRPTI
jgi:TRAP-type C4-dicarboxylate transport system permease small subunit